MTLIKFNNQRTSFPSLFESIFDNDPFFNTRLKQGALPAANVKETETSYELSLSVPGFSKEQFNIDLEKGMLHISAEVQSENEEKNDNFSRREFFQSSFKRSFTLPEHIDEEKISAAYREGILSIFIPKLAKVDQSQKRISIH